MNRVKPLSIFRYCPRCGSPDHLTVDIKKLECAACGFHYYQNAGAAVIALIPDFEGRLLFTRRAKPPAQARLDLPGGFVDPLEPAEAAVAREVEEETGLKIEQPSYLASFPNIYEYRTVTYYTLDMVFLCREIDHSKAAPLDEITRILRLRPEEVDFEEIGFPSVRAALNLYIQRSGRRTGVP
ncbi:MAG TPA: NUDIX domain-containing protein [Chthonomonadales bacterium]|nr:NUDIX domain-containing protein [Chthonomonadales bacterium]